MIGEHEAYCQPCVSPVWDTALTCHALAEAGGEETLEKMKQGLDWLKPRQVLDLKGDWAVKAPDVRPGGWAFQYNNDYYPDLDDTAGRAQLGLRHALPAVVPMAGVGIEGDVGHHAELGEALLQRSLQLGQFGGIQGRGRGECILRRSDEGWRG